MPSDPFTVMKFTFMLLFPFCYAVKPIPDPVTEHPARNPPIAPVRNGSAAFMTAFANPIQSIPVLFFFAISFPFSCTIISFL